MLSAGIDVGALWTKAVVLENGAIGGWGLSSTGNDVDGAAEQALSAALRAAERRRENLGAIVSTGVGAEELVLAQARATDVTCGGRGIGFLYPEATGFVDMGAEGTVVARLAAGGRVVDYARNDKCASGTGIFLDAMAGVMGLGIEEVGPLSLKSTAEVRITSTCVVFAESEVVSQVHRKTPVEDILRGIHRSIASRIYGLIGRVGLNGATVAIGGLARNVGIVASLEELMKAPLTVPERPHIVSALGAAIVAAENGGRA
jgi:(R)-2-hydroxyacyl-CoA dehydratese activating ATPase